MIGNDDYIIVQCLLHSAIIQERARGLLHSEAEKQVRELIDPIWTQVARDALVGTYEDYNARLFGPDGEAKLEALRKTADQAARIIPQFESGDLAKGMLAFQLQLQAKYFEDSRMGLQHLIHVLCGDIFSRGLMQIQGRVEVKSVALGKLGEAFRAHYSPRSHDIDSIRNAFNLDDAPLIYGNGTQKADLPLLAFSLKPRNGLSQEEFKRIALGVLHAGFNLVEVDVRNIEFVDAGWRATYGDIAEEALTIQSHTARFSMNLSGPADIAIPLAEEFKKRHPHGPWVIKIDGGLDGLSTIQAIRSRFKVGEQPIITCYPILSDVLASRIGPATYREMLMLCGADIIYPGGAPRIGEGHFVDYERLEVGIRRYRDFTKRGWPMPSIAGGVHAAQLPAYYEVLGPRVAYFIGGGVALHLNGPFYEASKGFFQRAAARPRLEEQIRVSQAVGGAELCRFAIEAAALRLGATELERVLGKTREHYIVPDGSQKETDGKYEFFNPQQLLVGSIHSWDAT